MRVAAKELEQNFHAFDALPFETYLYSGTVQALHEKLRPPRSEALNFLTMHRTVCWHVPQSEPKNFQTSFVAGTESTHVRGPQLKK